MWKRLAYPQKNSELVYETLEEKLKTKNNSTIQATLYKTHIHMTPLEPTSDAIDKRWW